jgi:hypothetical protein
MADTLSNILMCVLLVANSRPQVYLIEAAPELIEAAPELLGAFSPESLRYAASALKDH